MKTLNFTLVLVLAFVVNNAFATGGSSAPAPTRILTNNFLFTVKSYHQLFLKNEVATSSKVCSCQILNVKSNNEEVENVAVFAQKTNNGDISADLNAATATIEAAKKQMKGQFYSNVKVVAKKQVAIPCSELYKQLKNQNDNIKMYDILDADALSRKK
jgi:cell wall-associated NlpC family hydrolase